MILLEGDSWTVVF